ncbi:restriction endonuclease [Tenacibaculum finnmarkense genomovar finnmarkense]|uniref:restriction endonuclease n=1 Tax=Tenacibaculum finnmarkense TaxID=2781243 RepID=UPI001E3BE3A7|nr:restriction endonuclease [Tenacibaculum finnmarkense]MCD8418809.1 restriction endonuclease [Tenacibaculum finnmarkense genomovar finnmarkense]MCG8187108.1 restriction endonuclease [Tenacibaculum finnmarkense genomovar finnmarkense]MCG8211154.1 restriction endonuclease [Tenacibaculum finnmarkense genomovar finnmarkense]MCG8213900.1 restriction endonuclease [Tenacibaculum finnmarkense genomovar finnmarkense]MCG8221267.1 restriction endonuclease [Tenacibaculum finnmarkense genomovar finnmarken
MIFGKIKNWKDLQNKVSILLNQVGFVAETEKKITTPRGEIEIDVFAYDPKSIDKITYIIECKNWNNKIPQSVIHSFTSVMNETGGNIGYIISKKGFQKGSYDFINSTNINIFTFENLQERYLNIWLSSYFSLKLRNSIDSFLQYTEPINSRRFKYIDSLESKDKFNELFDKYQLLGMTLTLLSYSEYNNDFPIIGKLKTDFKNEFNIILESDNYSDLLVELNQIIQNITNQFNQIFGKNIFEN